jgi:capsular exopolysaccharide synthesis family protein
VAAIVVPLAALIVSAQQDEVYEAEAHVLLNRQSLANTLSGTTDPTIFQDDERVVQTQAELASVPEIARRTVAAVPAAGLTAQELLRSSNVQPEPNVDLLAFTVRHGDPELAARLANAYAREYTQYRTLVETRALVQARADVRTRIAELQAAGTTGAVLDGLLAKEQQLLTLETLQTGNASVLRASDEAERVQPRTLRNLALGLLLALGLGLVLAFVIDALDTRVRTADELTEALGLTLLGRVPPPSVFQRRGAPPEMLVDPESPAAEAFRMLRTSVDFANLDQHAGSIMITSAIEGEGKSTTAANLAVAYALVGKRVVLVDLDLRSPSLRQIFELGQGPGITDVALERVPLERALAPVPVDGLWVLQAGTLPPNPGEFVGSRALASVLEQLTEDADIVLVDVPPLLQVGDALTLSSAVDAVLVLARLSVLRRGMLADLRRTLEGMPAQVLGFAITGATDGVGYGYGTYGDRVPRGRGARRQRRVPAPPL